MYPIAIGIEQPRQAEIIAMLAELNRFDEALYPAEANHHLSLDELCMPEITFLVARHRQDGGELERGPLGAIGGGVAVGIGALWQRPGAHYGEVKRMYVPARLRGAGVGAALLAKIERIARTKGLPKLMLETGTLSAGARRLYTRAGFVECVAFGGYPSHPMSVFMEKPLLG